MVRHIELVIGRADLEALLTAPSHVLQGEERAVGRQQEVQVADPDERVVDGIDDVRQHTVLGGAEGLVGEGLIVAGATEDVLFGTLHPIRSDRRVDGLLHIGAIEVHDFPGWRVVAVVHYPQDAPEMGAGVGNVVNVEAGVIQQYGAVDVVEDIAG